MEVHCKVFIMESLRFIANVAAEGYIVLIIDIIKQKQYIYIYIYIRGGHR